MTILFPESFLKKLKKLGNISTINITTLLKKYPDTNQIIEIDSISNAKILKCYIV